MQRRRLLARGAALLVASPSCAAAPATVVRVVLRTAAGAIAMDVFLARAPRSASAFLSVVEAGGYDDGAFTRAVRPDNDHGTPPISVVQGRAAVAAPAVPHETTQETGLRHLDGTVSLPRDRPGTATGAAFFICVGDQPALDAGGTRNPDRLGFAAFARVTAGMDLVRHVWMSATAAGIAGSYTAGQMLSPPVSILQARRIG